MERHCENCGTKIQDNGQFCPKCGTKINQNTCPECGKDIENSLNFCENCGAKLTGTPENKHKRIPEEYKIPIIIIATVAILVLIGVIALSLTAHSNDSPTDYDYGEQTVTVGNVKFNIPGNYRLVPTSIDYGYENFVSKYEQSYSNGDETITLVVMYSPGVDVDAESVVQQTGGGIYKTLMGQQGYYSEYKDGYGFLFGIGNKLVMVVVSSPYMFDEISVLG